MAFARTRLALAGRVDPAVVTQSQVGQAPEALAAVAADEDSDLARVSGTTSTTPRRWSATRMRPPGVHVSPLGQPSYSATNVHALLCGSIRKMRQKEMSTT
ncbi:hypothetical protein SPBR_07962 [Sporothrix brasiliensis 5110]|uniref:Uncharacterized protein n=1 Tax=Sporothrix brasiliensis 5110 TaxID=1398154 RepID=A0A0C2IUR1_9PEZI|nr:uncharacterized protein SPBR_07962 [Sporothrix brasiliensis 5110]KIH88722.1 hypothetical protein SPBR_07962 [Sporothrix brasiliensis 5110]